MNKDRLDLLEAEALWPRLCAKVRQRQELSVEATRASLRAMEAASAASSAVGDAVTIARALATAMQGGAGSSKPPTLNDALQAAKALLADE